MRTPYSQIYVHLVWSTWDRAPLVTEELRTPVFACFQAECHSLGAELLAVGGMEDHVHLLVRFPTTVAVADLVKQLKGASTHMVTHRLAPGTTFRWQGGYGAFTISRGHLQKVRDYIRDQQQRHGEGLIDPVIEPPSSPSEPPPPS